MKKIIFIILSSIIGLQANAQSFHYGFSIGGSLANQKIHDPSILSTSSLRTFNAEIYAELPLKYDFSVRIGAEIANKGVIVFEDALTTTNKITYAEVPVLLIKKFEIPTLGKFAFGAGGYLAEGLSGTIQYETPSATNSDKISFGSNNDFVKADTGISIMSSLELNNKLTFGVGYDFGLTNIAAQTPKDTGTTSIYNRTLTVGLGLIF